MEDKAQKTIEEAVKLIASGLKPVRLKCPHCSKKMSLQRVAIFKDNTMTVTVKPSKGHLLWARTLGGILLNFDRLLSAASKAMGVKVGVLLSGFRFSDAEVSFDLTIMAAVTTREKSDAPAAAAACAGVGIPYETVARDLEGVNYSSIRRPPALTRRTL